MKKKALLLILTLISAAMVTACGQDTSQTVSDNQTTQAEESIPEETLVSQEITSKDVKIYWSKFDEPIDGKVYFIDGNTAVPYFEIEDFVALKNRILEIEKREASIDECKKDGSQVVLVRDNKSECIIDFEQSTIHFDNFDRFVQSGFSNALVSTIWRHETFEDGSPKYFAVSTESVNRNGYPITLSLADYDIHFAYEDSNYYVPVQTMSDILLNEMTNFIVYNGENLFISDDSMSNDLYESVFHSVPKGNRSEELATFTYNEFAFALDFNYGQKKEQNITDFKSYFVANDLEEALKSLDPKESSLAVKTVTNSLLGGRHNSLLGFPYMCEEDDDDFKNEMRSIHSANSVVENKYFSLYMNGREQAYTGSSEFVPRYEEVGDTAILTFGSFVFPDEEDYYAMEVSEDDLGDCYRGIDVVGLIKYAHAQINRENSPVKNVVIDLSNNTGGDMDAGVYLLAWIMGEAPLSVRDKATGAETTTYYRCDANYDGVFDENDNLTSCGKSVYCIISPYTFSCANFVSCVLKESQSAVILGRTSGGGTSAVDPLGLADGSVAWISGKYEICTVKNGTYYSVDKGATPDFTFTKMESFYDRENLVNIIHELY